MRENARTVREIIAAPVWEELNKFYLLVKAAARNGQGSENPFEFFNTVKRSGQLIVGIMEATMSRGEAWHFAQMGRLLRRGQDFTYFGCEVLHFAPKRSRRWDADGCHSMVGIAEIG